MSEYTELLERLDYDANCGPGDGLPSMLDIVAMDCKTAAEAIRSLLAERSANAIVRDAIFALMPESLYWAEVPDDIKALRERAAKAESELAAGQARIVELERELAVRNSYISGAQRLYKEKVDELAAAKAQLAALRELAKAVIDYPVNVQGYANAQQALRAALGEE